MKAFAQNLKFAAPLEPHHAFFDGWTNTGNWAVFLRQKLTTLGEICLYVVVCCRLILLQQFFILRVNNALLLGKYGGSTTRARQLEVSIDPSIICRVLLSSPDEQTVVSFSVF